MSEVQHGEDPQKWVVAHPKPTDILFGRGPITSNHPGNKVFLKLIKQRKTEYITAKDRLRKAKIAEEIVASLQAQQNTSPRFLRKAAVADTTRYGVPNGAWCIVDEKASLEKIKQALRQKASAWMESQLKSDKAPPLSDNLDTGKIAILPAEREETESPVAEFQDIKDHHPSQTCQLSFDEHHLEDNHSVASTNLAAIQTREAESQPDAFFESGYGINNPGSHLFGETAETRKAECTTTTHRRIKSKSPQEFVASSQVEKESPRFLRKAGISDASRVGISNDDTRSTVINEDSVTEETKQGICCEASPWNDMQEVSPHYNTKQSPFNTSTLRSYGQQAMVPQDEGLRRIQVLFDKSPNASAARPAPMDVLLGPVSCSNSPGNHLRRPKPVKKVHKTEYRAAKHNQAKFKIGQGSDIASPRTTKRKSSIFLQRATTNDELRLGVPTGAWFESSVLAAKRDYRRELFVMPSCSDASNLSTPLLEQQVKASPEAAQVPKPMVQQNLSTERPQIPDINVANACRGNVAACNSLASVQGSPFDSLSIECAAQPRQMSPLSDIEYERSGSSQEDLQAHEVSFDFQDHCSDNPSFGFEINATPKEERQAMVEEEVLPMEPSRLRQAPFGLTSTRHPRMNLQSGEMPHDDCDVSSNHINVHTSQLLPQQILVSPSESQEDLLIMHLTLLRDACLASAYTHRAGLQADDSSYHEYPDHFARQATVSRETERQPTISGAAAEDLLMHQLSLRDSCFASDTHRHPELKVYGNQDLQSSELMDCTMVQDTDPIQLSDLRVGEASLYNQELLATFMEHLPTLPDIYNSIHLDHEMTMNLSKSTGNRPKGKVATRSLFNE